MNHLLILGAVAPTCCPKPAFKSLTTAFMPEAHRSVWFKVAVKVKPATYVMEAMRAIVLEGWDWATILTGVWVAGAMLAVLLTATTWMYRRQTA